MRVTNSVESFLLLGSAQQVMATQAGARRKNLQYGFAFGRGPFSTTIRIEVFEVYSE